MAQPRVLKDALTETRVPQLTASWRLYKFVSTPPSTAAAAAMACVSSARGIFVRVCQCVCFSEKK